MRLGSLDWAKMRSGNGCSGFEGASRVSGRASTRAIHARLRPSPAMAMEGKARGGLSNARIQSYLTAVVMNQKRLAGVLLALFLGWANHRTGMQVIPTCRDAFSCGRRGARARLRRAAYPHGIDRPFNSPRVPPRLPPGFIEGTSTTGTILTYRTLLHNTRSPPPATALPYSGGV
jgi:hypothetical protein